MTISTYRSKYENYQLNYRWILTTGPPDYSEDVSLEKK